MLYADQPVRASLISWITLSCSLERKDAPPVWRTPAVGHLKSCVSRLTDKIVHRDPFEAPSPGYCLVHV